MSEYSDLNNAGTQPKGARAGIFLHFHVVWCCVPVVHIGIRLTGLFYSACGIWSRLQYSYNIILRNWHKFRSMFRKLKRYFSVYIYLSIHQTNLAMFSKKNFWPQSCRPGIDPYRYPITAELLYFSFRICEIRNIVFSVFCVKHQNSFSYLWTTAFSIPPPPTLRDRFCVIWYVITLCIMKYYGFPPCRLPNTPTDCNKVLR